MALAVPNFSEGAAGDVVAEVTAAFTTGAALLDSHSDGAHNRTVLSLSAPSEDLADALETGARACVERIDMRAHAGQHPCVGALDVCPVVWVDPADRAPAEELARVVAERIAALGVPVFLYGALAVDPQRTERSHFRRGGLAELARRMSDEGLTPDLGPASPHPTAGATLVTARPPLVAFNVELDTADVAIARAVAAGLRESGGGLAGVRAVGIDLGDRAQVSTNVHDPHAGALAGVVERVGELASAHGARPATLEIVGLVPARALAGLPAELPIRGFDPGRQTLEKRIARGAR